MFDSSVRYGPFEWALESKKSSKTAPLPSYTVIEILRSCRGAGEGHSVNVARTPRRPATCGSPLYSEYTRSHGLFLALVEREKKRERERNRINEDFYQDPIKRSRIDNNSGKCIGTLPMWNMLRTNATDNSCCAEKTGHTLYDVARVYGACRRRFLFV